MASDRPALSKREKVDRAKHAQILGQEAVTIKGPFAARVRTGSWLADRIANSSPALKWTARTRRYLPGGCSPGAVAQQITWSSTAPGIRRMENGMKRYAAVAILIAFIGQAPAQANPVAAFFVEFFGGYLAGKGLDEIWDAVTGKPDVKELASRLEMLEKMLANDHRDLSQRVADLRRDLTDTRKEVEKRPTKEEVRRIVLSVLAELEARVAKLDERVDAIERRVKQIEDLFGFIPQVPPSPLLRHSKGDGPPQAHPLMVEWATLLCRSEVNRTDIDRLRQIYKDNAPQLTEARQMEREILEQTSALHKRVKYTVAEYLPERVALLKTRKPSHPDVIELDDKIASLAWLIKMTEPIPDGQYKGRLRIPIDLVGPACSDILAAFELCRADVKVMTPLFRQLLTEHVGSLPSLADGGDVPDLPDDLATAASRANDLQRECVLLSRQAKGLDVALADRLKQFSELDSLVGTIREKKRERLKQVVDLNRRAEDLLAAALERYLVRLKRERITTPRMRYFRDAVLVPLAALCSVTGGTGTDADADKEKTWQRVRDWNGKFQLGRGRTVEFSRHAECAAITGEMGLTVVEVATGKLLAQYAARTVTEIAWSETGTLTFLADGIPVVGRRKEDSFLLNPCEWYQPHGQSIVAISPNGGRIAVANGTEITLSDFASGRGRTTLPSAGRGRDLACLAFSSDGATLAAGWKTLTINAEQFRGPFFRISTGRFLAGGTGSGRSFTIGEGVTLTAAGVEMWNVSSGKTTNVLLADDYQEDRPRAWNVGPLVFSSGGLVAVGLDGQLTVVGGMRGITVEVPRSNASRATDTKLVSDFVDNFVLGKGKSFAIGAGSEKCSFVRDGTALLIRERNARCRVLSLVKDATTEVAARGSDPFIGETPTKSYHAIREHGYVYVVDDVMLVDFENLLKPKPGTIMIRETIGPP